MSEKPKIQDEIESLVEKYPDSVDRMIAEIYGTPSVKWFHEFWEAHPELSLEQALEAQIEYPTSTQSHFFRTENIKIAAEQLVDMLKKKEGEPVQILDVGVSDGREAYSLGLHLLESGHSNFSIHGIDISLQELAEAEKAEYHTDVASLTQLGDHDTSKMKSEYVKKGYFVDNGKRWMRHHLSSKYDVRQIIELRKQDKPIPEDAYDEFPQVLLEPSNELRSKIDFELHDVIDGVPKGGPYDIIVMNHVLLHYPERTREKILQNVLSALTPGGFLVLEPALNVRGKEDDETETYSEWRRGFYKKFKLEPVKLEDPYLAENGNHRKWDMGQFYRLE